MLVVLSILWSSVLHKEERFLKVAWWSSGKLHISWWCNVLDLVFTFCLSRWGDRRQDQRFKDQVIMRKRPRPQCWYFPVDQLGALPPSAGALPWLPVRQGKGHPEVSQSSWFYSKSFERRHVRESSVIQLMAPFQGCNIDKLQVQLNIVFRVNFHLV